MAVNTYPYTFDDQQIINQNLGLPVNPLGDYSSLGNWGNTVAQASPGFELGLQPNSYLTNQFTDPTGFNIDSLSFKGFEPPGLSGFSKGIAGVNAASNLFGAWNAYNATKIAKGQLKENKRQFNMNWDANSKMVNSNLEDRQKQRVARDPNALSVSDYMAKYGI